MDMERAARPYIAAAAVLATGGLIAATPAVTPTLPDVQIPNIGLTAETINDPGDLSIFQSLLQGLHESDQALIDGLTNSNDALVSGPDNFIESIVNTLPAEDQALAENWEQLLLDAENALFGTGGGSFLGVLGAGEGIDPPVLNTSGFAPSAAGGAGGVAGQDAVVTSDVSTVVGYASGAAAASTLAQLQDDIAAFQSDLLAAEQGFNAALVEHELALEQATFGDENALNGVVNQSFSALNATFGAQEQNLNDLLGVTSPQDFTQTLLNVGGFDGASGADQSLLAEVEGLQSSDFEDLFANFKGDLFATALQNFFNFSSLDTDLTPLFADASNIIDAMFGSGA
jgi:hypothetical protein